MKKKPQTYNGWYNYATWRIALEMFDGQDDLIVELFDVTCGDEYEFARQLKHYVWNIIEEDCLNRLTRDYALCFLDNVNWTEIAEHYICNINHDKLNKSSK